MNAAVISFGVIVSVMTICGSALVWADKPFTGAVLLIIAIFGALSLLGMIVSTGVARPPARVTASGRS